jgi:hypothetical protein
MLKEPLETQKLRSAAIVLGVPRERLFYCEFCKALLNQPVEKSALYVLRDNEPLLICPKCALPDDLFIWGDPAHLDRRDWSPDMLAAEREREQARIDAEAMKIDMEDRKL